MENLSCFNIYTQDYRKTSKSRPEENFIRKDTGYNWSSSHYSLSQDHIRLENKNENTQNAFSQSNKADFLENQNEKCLLKSNDKSNRGIQHFDGDNPKGRRQYNLSKDKRRVQNKMAENKNFAFRPNRKGLRSRSAPSILSLASKQHASGNGNEQPENDFKDEKSFIEHPATILDESPGKFPPSSKKRNQEIKNSQRSRQVNVMKRHDTRRRLKIPIKKLPVTESGKLFSQVKCSHDYANGIKCVPDKRTSDESEYCSSNSESDLKHILKRENLRNERNMPDTNLQQSLKQNIPRSSFNGNVKYISNALRSSNYEAPNEKSQNENHSKKTENRFTTDTFSQQSLKQHIPRNSFNENVKYISNALRSSNYEVPYEKSHSENYSKKTESRFTTDSFLQQELSDFKEFLLYRRNQQRQKINFQQRLPTVYIPESIKLQKTIICDNRRVQNDYKNEKENAKGNRRENNPNLKTKQAYKSRRPKVSDAVLWKRFEQSFKSHASTKRYSGEVIPRKISTEWMREMGVVGDILAETDADAEFKKAAGSKITMNKEEYKEFLIKLTMKRKLPLYEIYRRMCGI